MPLLGTLVGCVWVVSDCIRILKLQVKKAYLRVVRFIHPDKLPPDLETASKLLVERVFIHLTQKFDLYRKAHDLG